ncbi:hypothetical protein JIX56_28790 [Streptomyces sp. CA-210063]|uniref:hypothetical protein n=1 Tax=Streptomyces sp. CA-210063 TaxID=2801029 RepID=UPI00214CB512|nr:hypothetical protein [Streptomyces sp. CA-210063]UUU33527.1 hypothetical protein JIX56_28790 [Streptomyces sp. CA-210063]
MGFDIDKDLHFVRKEVEGIKKSMTGFSHSMTGIKVDVEGLKFVVSWVAATAQFIKIDYSFLKVDEKGISLRGVQKITWQNVKDAEDAKAKEKEKKLDDRLKKLFLEKSGAEFKSVKDTANRARYDIQALREKLKKAGSAADPGNRGTKREELDTLRKSAENLSRALSDV